MRKHRIPFPERITLILFVIFAFVMSPLFFAWIGEGKSAIYWLQQSGIASLRLFVPIWLFLRLIWLLAIASSYR
jgi:hypothetical protein